MKKRPLPRPYVAVEKPRSSFSDTAGLRGAFHDRLDRKADSSGRRRQAAAGGGGRIGLGLIGGRQRAAAPPLRPT